VHLDSFTLLAASSVLLAIFGLAFVVLWLRDRAAVWLLWWGLPLIINGVALTLYLRGGWQDDAFTVMFGNAARIFALGSLWYAIRLFQGRRPPWGTVSGIVLLWVALCLYPPFVASMPARIIAVSLISAAICALAVREIWRDRADGLRSRLPLLGVFAGYGILMLGRVPLVPVAPFPIGAGPLDPNALAVFAGASIALVVFATIFFFSLTMERREAEQRSFALSDPLTGLLNRRAFGDFAQRMGRRRTGLRDEIALLVLDLDRFKLINDRYGHEAGDRMLKAFTEVSESSVRPSDQLFRMGGEEFCFVLPDTSLADAIAVAERIRKTFERCQVETGSGPAATTVSIGIAATRYAVDIEVLLAGADAAVYEAKARGRNRVVVAEPATLLRSEPAAAEMQRRA
jgi:diguanylate cyclase (GGDEF)-like protein